jgi:hypothetical protein
MYNMISTRQLTPKGDRAIRDLAQHYGVSVEAVRTLLFAVSAGGGTLAQFDHPELGGSGQWERRNDNGWRHVQLWLKSEGERIMRGDFIAAQF